jgi:hypothetical protein
MDWIKVQKNTPNKGEIKAITRECQCSNGDAFLAWFRVWSEFDSMVGEDGFLPDYTHNDVDELARMAGVGASLERSGWLVFGPHGCSITNWTRHNGKSAKQRSNTARRAYAFRQRNGEPLRPVTLNRDSA